MAPAGTGRLSAKRSIRKWLPRKIKRVAGARGVRWAGAVVRVLMGDEHAPKRLVLRQKMAVIAGKGGAA